MDNKLRLALYQTEERVELLELIVNILPKCIQDETKKEIALLKKQIAIVKGE